MVFSTPAAKPTTKLTAAAVKPTTKLTARCTRFVLSNDYDPACSTDALGHEISGERLKGQHESNYALYGHTVGGLFNFLGL